MCRVWAMRPMRQGRRSVLRCWKEPGDCCGSDSSALISSAQIARNDVELGIQGLLKRPGAIVDEAGDPVRWRHEVAAIESHPIDEVQDRRPGLPVKGEKSSSCLRLPNLPDPVVGSASRVPRNLADRQEQAVDSSLGFRLGTFPHSGGGEADSPGRSDQLPPTKDTMEPGGAAPRTVRGPRARTWPSGRVSL